MMDQTEGSISRTPVVLETGRVYSVEHRGVRPCDGYYESVLVHIASSLDKAIKWIQTEGIRPSVGPQDSGGLEQLWWYVILEEEVDCSPGCLGCKLMGIYDWNGQEIDYQPIGGYKAITKERIDEFSQLPSNKI